MFDTDLPIHDALPALRTALERGPNAVLVAPPGAGKTTTVPLALLDAPWLAAGQRIVMLEPRRIAARAAAARMSALIGEPVGTTVGYRTRIDSAVSAATRIEVVTEGLLVRRLLADPTLAGVACVILDEIHERSADADLALAFCLDLQRRLRPELRLLAMSATLDAARLSELLAAPVVESAGRMFPVEIRQAKSDIEHLRTLPERMAAAIRGALAETGGAVLAFLPGRGEIARTESALAGCGVPVLPLHGELTPAAQDRALADTGKRVVLATSIAETSLTVPGVRVVVDGGYRRMPRFDPGSGLSRLQTLRVSRAAADQRAGRAGREAPGLAIRLWTAATQRALAVHDRPELLDSDLAGPALDIAAWCREWQSDPDTLPLPDAPPAGAWAAARTLLAELGALDADGAITSEGLAMAALGAHPRLAAMMRAATTAPARARAADLAALLEERDPVRPGRDRRGLPVPPPAEIGLRLALVEGAAPDADLAVDRGALARIRDAGQRYRRRLGVPAALPGDGSADGALLAAAFPDRIAQRRGEPGAFRLSGGGGAKLPALDPLANANLLVAAGLHVRQSAQIVLAAPLDADSLPRTVLDRTAVQDECNLDPVSGAVLNRRRLRLGALVLSDKTLPADPALTARTLAAAALARAAGLNWDESARQMQARIALARTLDPALPDLSDVALAADPSWLVPHLDGVTKLAEIARLDLAPILRGQLDGAQRAALERDLPAHLALPGGRAAIDYTQPVPTASARAQAFYGMRESPRLAGGRVALQFALLSPAGRPCAITADLARFWQGAWAETRREMRGRYPRHDWPETP